MVSFGVGSDPQIAPPQPVNIAEASRDASLRLTRLVVQGKAVALNRNGSVCTPYVIYLFHFVIKGVLRDTNRYE